MCKKYTTTNRRLRIFYTLFKKVIKKKRKRLRMLRICYIIGIRLY